MLAYVDTDTTQQETIKGDEQQCSTDEERELLQVPYVDHDFLKFLTAFSRIFEVSRFCYMGITVFKMHTNQPVDRSIGADF